MTPDTPGTPDQGTPDEAKVAQDAAETKEATAKKPAAKKKAAAKKKPAAKPAPEAVEAPIGDDADAVGTTPEDDRDDLVAKKAAAKKRAAKKPAARKGAPARRRRSAEVDPDLVVRAHARYVRSSARKARLVCDHIRGKSVDEARSILAFSPRQVSEAWSKLLESAVANAENNHDLDVADLRIAAVFADEGPTLKRFRPRAMGRATRIRKRTSHLTNHLTPKA